MNIVSWNIQAGLGLDGQVNLQRIADVLRQLPFGNAMQADVICLQEVARNFSALTNGVAMDQPKILQDMFADYDCVFRPAVDLAPLAESASQARRQFGCMILSKRPIQQVFNHLLTQKGATGKRMQRHLLEVVIDTSLGAMRVGTTHLEFNSHACRLAQVEQILSLHHETQSAGERTSAITADSPYSADLRPATAIMCGDFNFLPDSPEYLRMTNSAGAFCDAWQLVGEPKQVFPTCGFDCPTQWPEGPHCRDFFFVTSDLAQKIQSASVDVDTRASDHQPIFMTLR